MNKKDAKYQARQDCYHKFGRVPTAGRKYDTKWWTYFDKQFKKHYTPREK